MIRDPIVAEVRRNREKWAAQFGYDVRAIARDAMKRESKNRNKVAPPKHARASR